MLNYLIIIAIILALLALKVTKFILVAVVIALLVLLIVKNKHKFKID